MKKQVLLILSFIFLFSFVACSSEDEESISTALNQTDKDFLLYEKDVQINESALPQETSDGNSVLIAYFSWADNAVVEGETDAVTSPSVIAPGNVAQMAYWIEEEIGGDLFSIQVTQSYSSDWDACLERANQERSDNARPELIKTVENMEGYDTVFLGYPNWWYGAPMALLSFMEQNDLSGKKIYLFCSHGTGGLANSVEDIKEVLPENAQLSENVFDIYEEDVPNSQNDVISWLEALGY